MSIKAGDRASSASSLGRRTAIISRRVRVVFLNRDDCARALPPLRPQTRSSGFFCPPLNPSDLVYFLSARSLNLD
jgi:hypothetical protein